MDMNLLEAVEYGLSKLNLKSLKERKRNAVEGYLSSQYVFVYSQIIFKDVKHV